MRFYGLLLMSAALAGCASGPDPQAPFLGGVNLDQPVRALGTEPFWAIDIDHDQLVYSGVDRPETRAPFRRTVLRDSVVYEARTPSGTAIRVELTPRSCSDGMSDRTYPLTVQARVGQEALRGCAASTRAIMTTGESGPVL